MMEINFEKEILRCFRLQYPEKYKNFCLVLTEKNYSYSEWEDFIRTTTFLVHLTCDLSFKNIKEVKKNV